MTQKILLDAGPSRKGWHRIETFLRCPQLFAFKYRAGLKAPPPPGPRGAPALPAGATFRFELAGAPAVTAAASKQPNALERGSIIHVGLAQHYARVRAEQQGGIADLYYTPREGVFLTAAAFGLDEATTQRFYEIVCGYQAHYMYDRSVVLEVEQERLFWFEADGKVRPMPLDSPVHPPAGIIDITTRWDRVCRATDGKVYVHDLKTTSSPTTNATSIYSMSGQMLLAGHLGRAIWGEEFGGVVVDLIPLVGDKPPQRIPLTPAPHASRKAVSTLRWAEEQIAALDARALSPWEWPQAMNELMCCHRYGVCDFMALCQRGP